MTDEVKKKTKGLMFNIFCLTLRGLHSEEVVFDPLL